MTAHSLMQMCAQLGIKLSLKGDNSDRLQVDAPKGALTASLRDALAANKADLLVLLKSKQQPSYPPQASTLEHDSEVTRSRVPAITRGNSPEATPLIFDQPFSRPSVPYNDADIEVSKVSESDYAHAISRLRTADSPAERVAAARKLGTLGDRRATDHLIAALQDGAPEVRRASTESLGQIGDMSAVAPLNDLLLRETSRQLPEAVIKHALNSISAAEVKRSSVSEPSSNRSGETPVSRSEMSVPVDFETPIVRTQTPASSAETPAPRREIFADYLRSFEERTPLTNRVSSPIPAPPASTINTLDAADEQLRQEEEALRRAADDLERKRAEAEAARARAEEEGRVRAASEAVIRAQIEARIHAEEEARRRMVEEAARQKAEEEEARVKAEQEARSRIEQEALFSIEEEARFRLEAETLRKAAEELARKRSEAEATRKIAEEQARLRAEHEAKLKAEEEALARAAEEARRQAEDEMRRRVEEEIRRRADEEARRRAEEEVQARAADDARMKAAVEARLLAELEIKRKAESEAQRREEEELLARATQDAHRRAEEERQWRDSGERYRVDVARIRAEYEALMQVAAELSRRRSELEAARQNAEAEARLLIEAEELAKVEEESRRQRDGERQQRELEARRRAEEEQLAEARRRAAEERQLTAEHARLRAEEEERRLAELESVRTKAEEEAGRRAEKEQRIKAEIFALTKAEEEQRVRIEAEIRRRTEAQARLKEQETRAEEEARQVAEEIRENWEEHAQRHAEVESRLKEEETRLTVEQETRARTEKEAHRLAEETRLQAAEEARRRAEVEALLREEEARRQAEQQARARAEEEATRLAEDLRLRAEEESRLRAEGEARLKEEQAHREAPAETSEQVLGISGDEHLRVDEEPIISEVEAPGKVEEVSLQSNEEDLLESFDETFRIEAIAADSSSPEPAWMDSGPDGSDEIAELLPIADDSSSYANESPSPFSQEPVKEIEVVFEEKGIISAEDESGIPSDMLKRLESGEASEREAALAEVVGVGGDDAFRFITRMFDDQSAPVRNAAARALYNLQPDRAATFTRALREGTPERRRKIGQALAASGLAKEAVGNLTGESREKTYDAFSLLFLMAKAGEVQPLMQAIEDYPNVEVRIAVVKLLALSGQPEVVPAFRRLAVRGSLPSEVRSAVMEAIYQISSQARESAPSAA